jgi:hypothetical protein
MAGERALALKIRFLYSDDCPSHEKALRRLRESIEAEGIRAKVEVLKVDTEEKAEKLKYVGSPTIIVNGHDIDPPQTPQYAVTCRAYRLDDGRISPMPPEAMIREALRQARAKES